MIQGLTTELESHTKSIHLTLKHDTSRTTTLQSYIQYTLQRTLHEYFRLDKQAINSSLLAATRCNKHVTLANSSHT